MNNLFGKRILPLFFSKYSYRQFRLLPVVTPIPPAVPRALLHRPRKPPSRKVKCKPSTQEQEEGGNATI